MIYVKANFFIEKYNSSYHIPINNIPYMRKNPLQILFFENNTSCYGKIDTLQFEKIKRYFKKINNYEYINLKCINYVAKQQNSCEINMAYIFKNFSVHNFSDFKNLIKVKSPLFNDCFINEKQINCIKEEDYLTISPNLIEAYLKENNIKNNKLFHVFFKDNSILSILNNPFI